MSTPVEVVLAGSVPNAVVRGVSSGWLNLSAGLSTLADRVILVLLALSELPEALARVATLVPAGSPLGLCNVDLPLLGRFSAGSLVLLRGTSDSMIISLLLFRFLDIFAEMFYQ